MSEMNEIKGAIEIFDNLNEITIPDIANQQGYFLSLFHQSGFEQTIITNASNREGDPVSFFQFFLPGGKSIQYLVITNRSDGDSVSYHFTLKLNEDDSDKRQASIILYNIMTMILYGDYTDRKIMTKELMDGTKIQKDNLVILEY